MEIEYNMDEMEEKETKDIRCHRESFKNANEKGAETKHTVSYERIVSSTAVFREAKEFSTTGELSAGKSDKVDR